MHLRLELKRGDTNNLLIEVYEASDELGESDKLSHQMNIPNGAEHSVYVKSDHIFVMSGLNGELLTRIT